MIISVYVMIYVQNSVFQLTIHFFCNMISYFENERDPEERPDAAPKFCLWQNSLLLHYFNVLY